MLWLGLAGRVKIGALEARMEALERSVKQYDAEVTDAIDKLSGIAKRFTGRKGGRPPREANGEAEETESADTKGFSRHVL